jgi:hypothetical protein
MLLTRTRATRDERCPSNDVPRSRHRPRTARR